MEWVLVALGAVAVLVVARLLVRPRTGGHDSGRLTRLDRKLDLLAEHLGATVSTPLPDDVQTALRAGNKIEAIRRYRAATGAGLKEAKDAVEGVAGLETVERKVDALLAQLGIAAPDQSSDSVRDAVRAGQTIEAIKRYRAETGSSLQEAKAAIDAIAREPDKS